ncbi:metal-dependent hydrolase [Vibrio splendidus]|nr:metal-dependent hydrolase [Vibrio splendidus]MCC4880351.1 metal-dependent hydrolase [Vibrio splendidus]
MNRNGHLVSGVLATPFPALVAYAQTDLIGAGLAIMFTILGVNAPDYLEIRYTKKAIKKIKDKKTGKYKEVECMASTTLIPHRGITHTLGLWLIAFVLPLAALCDPSLLLRMLGDARAAIWLIENNYASCMLFGYAFGGLLHLFCDIPNKKGIPIFPFVSVKIKLNLWKSGEKDMIMYVASLLLAVSLCCSFGVYKDMSLFVNLWENIQSIKNYV